MQNSTTSTVPLVFLMGPTAAGKTELALRLCDEFPFEIISVDSALIYRRLNIGSAKPPPHVLRQYCHHLVDIREPHETYSAADFRNDALACIEQISARGNVPLLVGGTGLYFRTLEFGISELPAASQQIRDELHDEYQTLGGEKMHRRLANIDPQSARRIHPNDPQRLLRALEIFNMTGKTMSALLSEPRVNGLSRPPIKFIFAPPVKASLHERIEKRFQQMLSAGFLNEVMGLRADQRLNANLPSIRAVGYRAAWQFLDGEFDFEQMIHNAIVATRRLAKRQYTWFRSESAALWVDAMQPSAFDQVRNEINRKTFND